MSEEKYGHPDWRFSVYVQTLGADNLIIDKLTIGAYTENRRTLQNNATETSDFEGISPTAHCAKFYPRGCRGAITKIHIYARNAYSYEVTAQIGFSPFPTIAPYKTVNVTIPGNYGPDWLTADCLINWPFDSLFITVSAEVVASLGYDEYAPYDAYYSTDGGETWTPQNRRYWIKVDMYAQTVGDVPVSGTITTIPVRTSTTSIMQKMDVLEAGAQTNLITINEPGKNLALWMNGSHDKDLVWTVTLDSEKVWWPFRLDYFSFNHFRSFKLASPNPLMGLHDYTEDGFCGVYVAVPFEWQKKAVVTVKNDSDTNNYSVGACWWYLKSI